MMTKINRAEVVKRFSWHDASESRVEQMETIRGHFRAIAFALVERMPESREASLAITRLEESMFWANASIARKPKDEHQPKHDERVEVAPV